MIAGRPVWSSAARAASIVLTSRLRGDSRPMRSIASRNSWRSSALAMTSGRAPMTSTRNVSSVPSSCSAMAAFSAVCPPIVGSSASGRSASMTRARKSGVIGST